MIPRDNEHIRIISEVKAPDGRVQTTFALGRFLITWNEYVKDGGSEKPIRGRTESLTWFKWDHE